MPMVVYNHCLFLNCYTGGRPDNWTDISTECLYLIESLTNNLAAEVSLQTHFQQPPLDPKVLAPALTNGQANGHVNGHAGLPQPLFNP